MPAQNVASKYLRALVVHLEDALKVLAADAISQQVLANLFIEGLGRIIDCIASTYSLEMEGGMLC
jgi:hypothetical protein